MEVKSRKILIIIILFLLGGITTFSAFTKKSKTSDIHTELQKEIADYPLDVTGTIPSWLEGTLIRNGPIKVIINDQSNMHWFDGLAMLHAFSFHEGHITYSNKFLRSDAYRTVFEEGSLHYDGFASDSYCSLWKRFFTFFFPPSDPIVQNANVNVVKLANQYVALTETPLPVKFDLHTLDTLGVLGYQDALPQSKCWESATPHYDFTKNQTLNYLIEFGKTSYYTIYSLEDHSSQKARTRHCSPCLLFFFSACILH